MSNEMCINDAEMCELKSFFILMHSMYVRHAYFEFFFLLSATVESKLFYDLKGESEKECNAVSFCVYCAIFQGTFFYEKNLQFLHTLIKCGYVVAIKFR